MGTFDSIDLSHVKPFWKTEWQPAINEPRQEEGETAPGPEEKPKDKLRLGRNQDIGPPRYKGWPEATRPTRGGIWPKPKKPKES